MVKQFYKQPISRIYSGELKAVKKPESEKEPANQYIYHSKRSSKVSN